MSKSNKNRNLEYHEKVERIPFHSAITGVMSGGSGSFNIAPATFGRLNTVADTYALYRFSDLRFRMRPMATRSTLQSAAYLPGAVDTVPSTPNANAEALESVVLGATEVVPTEWAVVKNRDLMSYLPWYKTIVGSPDPIIEIQGAIFLNGTGTDAYAVEVRGICDFKSPINTASTPMLARQALIRKERERLLYLLTSGSTATSGVASVSPTVVRDQLPQSSLGAAQIAQTK
jgi:hypothetical protein